MAYRGDIPANSIVNVALSADFTNIGNAMMMVGVGPFGSDPSGKSIVVAPGGTASLQVSTPQSGILKVFVDFADNDDSGRLGVEAAGGFRDGDPTTGDTVWTYSV